MTGWRGLRLPRGLDQRDSRSATAGAGGSSGFREARGFVNCSSRRESLSLFGISDGADSRPLE